MGLRTIAFSTIRRRKGKAALVILGLATAVGALVLVLSLILSLRATMDERLSKFGSNLIVTPAETQLSLTYGGVSVANANSAKVPTLSAIDLERVRTLSAAANVAAAVPVLLEPVEAEGRTFLAMGTDLVESATMKPWWRIIGQIPARDDEVLLGLNVRNALRSDAGETVVLQGRAFTVAGVLEETGSEEDNLVLMRLDALAGLSERRGEVNLIEVVATSTEAVDELARQIEAAVPGSAVASVKKSVEFTERANSSLANFGLAVTLLIVTISGLVVMITMLAMVKERQKEIGIFRAVGYKQRHIMKLVLLEAVLLSGPGAVMGVAAGLLTAFLAPGAISGLSLRVAPNPVVILAGLALAFAIGLAAALYPAHRAAAMDPATALKHI